MSVSKWRYTEECNGRPCPGDCDHCSFEPADLISRADAIEAVQKELVCDGRHETHDKTCRFIADVLLSALPSADAVQGEWIKKHVFNPELDKYVPLIECSVCGYEPYFGGSESKFNYCANCGARMKGDTE